MTRDEMLTRLLGLLPAQFEEVIFRAGVPPEYLPASSAAQATRAIEVLRYVQQRQEIDQLAQIIDGVLGVEVTGSRRPSVDRHTILFLAANPVGTSPLALDQQARAIQVELERSGYRDRFDFVTRWAAEPLDLLRELRRLRPALVHFSGHSGQAGLYFQGPGGVARLVSAAALARTFQAAGDSVRVIVLDACYSRAQADALLAHVDCVIGTDGSIRGDAARHFAIGFYGGLGERESVARAYQQGRAAISLEGLYDDATPQLRVRRGVDAKQIVLAAESS